MKLSAESTSALVSSRTWSPVCTLRSGKTCSTRCCSSVCDTPSPATSMYSTCWPSVKSPRACSSVKSAPMNPPVSLPAPS